MRSTVTISEKDPKVTLTLCFDSYDDGPVQILGPNETWWKGKPSDLWNLLKADTERVMK